MKPFDLQVNGYAGGDFCSESLTAEQLHRACEALHEDGVDGILATVITDSVDRLAAKLANLARLREADPLASELIAGIHLEGPFLNRETGYIGAHPAEAVVPADVESTKRLLEAAGGLIRLVTLAPENDPDFATTRFLAREGITVSAGHCNPSLDELKGAVDAGLTMFTHLGNGCPVDLPRHDNIIQRVLALRDRLWICFIPDGAHIPFFALRNYLDLVGLDRSILVTDAIGAARLGPGRYELSGMEVDVDAHGVARKPGSPNLAGSTVTMPQIRANLTEHFGYGESEMTVLLDRNPRSALRMDREAR